MHENEMNLPFLLSIVDLINFRIAWYNKVRKRKIAFFTVEKITPLFSLSFSYVLPRQKLFIGSENSLN